ncbi:MAG: hypothetical protein AAF802_15920 [Planctomycetota bacterium]
MNEQPVAERALNRLRRLLHFVGVFTLLAFVAAVMPATWIQWSSDELDVGPFPDQPVAFYLARHLSMMYGFIGLALIVFAKRLRQPADPRDLELASLLGYAVVAFGVGQAVLDLQSEMPHWWTAAESLSTVFGGVLILWLVRQSRLGVKTASASHGKSEDH